MWLVDQLQSFSSSSGLSQFLNTPDEETFDTWLDPAKKKKKRKRRRARKRKPKKKKPDLPSKELKARSRGSGKRENLVVTEKMHESLVNLLLL